MVALRKLASSLPLAGRFLDALFPPPSSPPGFRSSPDYWETRYSAGGNSGSGSYGRLASFKAEVLNRFVADNGVSSVVEFGCGDGAQLALADYPEYLGVDVSQTAVDICARRFAGSDRLRFETVTQFDANRKFDLALSLDVVYHLVEDDIFDAYMRRLVAASRRFVGVYSSDFDGPGPAVHVRHRNFSNWISANAPDWSPLLGVDNPYPYDEAQPAETTWAKFRFFSKP